MNHKNLLIKVLKTEPDSEVGAYSIIAKGICNHIEYTLGQKWDHDEDDVEEVLNLFVSVAHRVMGYPLGWTEIDYWLFPLDEQGNYVKPEVGELDSWDLPTLSYKGKTAHKWYEENRLNPWKGLMGEVRFKLIKDVLKELEK